MEGRRVGMREEREKDKGVRGKKGEGVWMGEEWG